MEIAIGICLHTGKCIGIYGFLPDAHQLAVFTEVIEARRIPCTTLIAGINPVLAYCQHTIASDIVLGTIHFDQTKTLLDRTVNQIANKAILCLHDTGFIFIYLDQLACHIIKVIQQILRKRTNSKNLVSSVEIPIFIETVGFAVDLLQHIVAPVVTVRAVEVLNIAVFPGVPYTVCQITFTVEYKGDTRARTILEGKCACLCKIISRGKVVPVIINQIPSALQLTGNSIAITVCGFVIELTGILGLVSTNTVFTEVVIVAVDGLYASQFHAINIVSFVDPACICNTVGISLSVAINTIEHHTAVALKYTINHLVGVTGCRNCDAPVENRSTTCFRMIADICFLLFTFASNA